MRGGVKQFLAVVGPKHTVMISYVYDPCVTAVPGRWYSKEEICELRA